MKKTLTTALVILGLVTAPAAAQTTQAVTGVVGGTLAISAATPAAFSNLSPGSTDNSLGGTVTVLSTQPNWQLTAHEANGDGRLSSTAPLLCEDSAATLANPLGVAIGGPAIGGVTKTPISLSGEEQVIASATAQPVPLTTMLTNLSQAVNANETLTSGCTYGATITYTLSAGL